MSLEQWMAKDTNEELEVTETHTIPDKRRQTNFYRLIQGDSRNVLKKLSDNSVDCIITDPPYGVEFDTAYRKEKPENIGSFKYDNSQIFLYFPAILFELKRILKSNSAFYSFCRWDVIDHFKPLIERAFTIKNLLIWVKNNWSMGDLEGAYASQYECCFYSVLGKPQLNGARDTDILTFDRVSNARLLHSAQKPVDLIKFLIEKSTRKGDIILDPFLGSGTTMVACQQLQRSCIGIEIDPRYVEVTKKRCFGRQFFDRKVNYEFEVFE